MYILEGMMAEGRVRCNYYNYEAAKEGWTKIDLIKRCSTKDKQRERERAVFNTQWKTTSHILRLINDSTIYAEMMLYIWGPYEMKIKWLTMFFNVLPLNLTIQRVKKLLGRLHSIRCLLLNSKETYICLQITKGVRRSWYTIIMQASAVP